MTREKIIELALDCGMAVSQGGNGYWDNYKQMDNFYNAARNEALDEAIKLCLGHESGHWGAGARACAAVIRGLKK